MTTTTWRKRARERWKRIAHKIGDFQARLLLTLFYFIVLAPFALVMRWTSDPLTIKTRTAKGWQSKAPSEASPLTRAYRQF